MNRINYFCEEVSEHRRKFASSYMNNATRVDYAARPLYVCAAAKDALAVKAQ